LPEPLQDQDIIRHRAISAADSSRNLPPRTAGILSGQDVLTLPNMQFKLQAQIAGLGAGYMPTKIAEHYASKGQLVIKQVAKPKHEVMVFLAWRSDGGKAQQWFIKQFQLLNINDILLSPEE